MIDTKKNLSLEFIRGSAALLVMFGHFFHYLKDLSRYNNHITALFFNWGRECVLLFFILSGIVVHFAFDKRNRNNLTFIKERIIRLHPTLFISLIICLIIEFYYFNNTPSFNTIIGNFIPYSTMPGYLAPLFWDTNAAIWSLTFEMFFYTIFGVFIIKNKRLKYKRINIWFLLSIVAIFFYYNKANNLIADHFILMLSFSGVWLIGFYIYKWKHLIYTDSKVALIAASMLPLVSRIPISNNYYDPIMFNLFGLTATPLFAYLLQSKENTIQNKKYTLTFLLVIYLISSITIALEDSYPILSKTGYIILPAFSLIISNIKTLFNTLQTIIKRFIILPFSFFGKYSYSIYLLHTPFIILANQLRETNLSLKIIFIITLTFFLSYIIENYFQPYINKKLL